MKYFKINYRDKAKLKHTIVEAIDKNSAKDIFHHRFQSFNVGKIEEIKKPLSFTLKNLIPKVREKIDLVEYIAILDNIATTNEAGINLNKTLEHIVSIVKNKKLKEIFSTLLNDINNGSSVSKSLEKYEQDLGEISIVMFKLGETSGNMPDALNNLAETLRDVKYNRDRLKKATRYPIFLLVSMVFAFIIVILMVIPEFQAMFKSFRLELPTSTKFLLLMEHTFRNYWYVILGGILIVFNSMMYFYHKTKKGRYLLDKLQLKTYFLGKVIESAMLLRFITVFNKLNKVGIPIYDSLDLSNRIVTNEVMNQNIRKIKKSIEKGKSLSEAFGDSNLFEPVAMLMINAGDEAGEMDKMLDKVEIHYKKRYEVLLDSANAYIEPLLIVSLLGFVAVLAFGIFFPLWDLSGILK